MQSLEVGAQRQAFQWKAQITEQSKALRQGQPRAQAQEAARRLPAWNDIRNFALKRFRSIALRITPKASPRATCSACAPGMGWLVY